MADNAQAFNSLKIEIRSILIPHQKGCTLFQFRKDYKQMLGRDIPHRNFNYQDDLHLLKSIPDTVRVSQWGGDIHLMAVADESTQHIQKMVAKQKPAKQKSSRGRQPSRYTSRPASRAGSYSGYSTPYAARPGYAASLVGKRSSASQFAPAKPSYASQSAQFDSKPFTTQPVRGMPSCDSQPALAVNKPAPIARQSASSQPSFNPSFPAPITRQSASNQPSFNPSFPAAVASQAASSVRKPAASSTAGNGWVGQRQSDIPPRFRAPVNDILPPDVECRIVSLVRKFTTGLRMSDFPMAYQSYFKEMFSWEKHGFNTLKQCLDSIPDLALSLLHNDFVIYYVDKCSPKPTPVQQPAERPASSRSPSAPCDYQKQDIQSFNQETEAYNLKSNSPSDEKSQYYQDRDIFQKLSSKEGAPKKKADVLDTFELSSTASVGVTDKIKNNMREIVSKNKQGIFATEFPALYESMTGSRFDLHSLGFTDLTDLVDALPDIFRRRRVEGSRKDWIIVPPEEEEVECSPNKSVPLIDSSIQNIRKILQGFPEGIQLSEFLNVYTTNLKEPLYILDLGFSCVDDFLLSISERVPLKIETVDGIRTVFLTETEQVVPPIEEPIPTAGLPSFPVYEEEESIPFDAASPDCQYRLQPLPDDFDRSLFVPAYTSAVFNPGHLYVQLESQENTDGLTQLYEEIEEFYYGPYSHQYQFKRAHLKERAMCAALWPQKKDGEGDDKWYRALVTAHRNGIAKVFYVDYGTTDVVPLHMLRYLKVAFTKFPAQAIKARLAHLKPPNNAPRFSPGIQKRMLELCMDVKLMAKVEDEQDGVLSLILCNTNGNQDVFINDVLLEEGLADSVNEANSPPPLLQGLANSVNEANSPPALQQEYPPHQVMQAQCYWEMFNHLSLTMSPEQVASKMQLLSLNYRDNPLVQQYAIRPPSLPTPTNSPPASDESEEIFQDDDDLFEEFYQKASSVSKRYVKRVRTSDGYFFHVLIVEGGAFVSSGDISMLIWNDKSPHYLLERLQTRDIIFPSHCISERGNESMFHQFEKFHVKGTQSNGDSSSIIIYPLKSAIPILNVYGHPSLELRDKIMREIQTFNPHLPAWQEVSDVEIPDCEEEVFEAVTDDDKLNRLCIHDLVAMKEGIRLKRNNLVRKLKCSQHDESTVDEMDKLEGLLKRVVVRIEQINQICATFS